MNVEIDGIEYPLRLTVGAIARVRHEASTDLLDAVDGDLLSLIDSNPVLCGTIAAAILRPELEKRNLSKEAFLDSVGGAEHEALKNAIFEELVNFSQNPGQRKVLRTARVKMAAAKEKAATKALEFLESGRFEAMTDAQLEHALGKLGTAFSSVPESAESSPGDSPSVS